METFKTSESADGPHPVDIHIGQHIRALRIRRGLSQSALGERIGITFQQVQKYERGTNRVSCSRLYQIAGVLGVAIADFYEGLPDPAEASGSVKPVSCHSFTSVPDALSPRLVEAFTQLPPRLRKASYGLITAIAGAVSSLDANAVKTEGGDDA